MLNSILSLVFQIILFVFCSLASKTPVFSVRQSEITTPSSQCPFASQCTCTEFAYGATLGVECRQLKIFPTFLTYNLTGYENLHITMSGDFTMVPSNCIYNLFGVKREIYISISGNNQMLLFDSNAFNYSSQLQIGIELHLQHFAFSSNHSTIQSQLQTLKISLCNVSEISDYFFQGFSGIRISTTFSGVKVVAQKAFDGLDPIYNFDIRHNSLTDVSSAFRTLQTKQLILANNKIDSIQNYSFCPCINSTCQKNEFIEYISLRYNPISVISDKAFANLPYLNTLDLSYCRLASLPVSCFKPIPSLTSLLLQNNLISNIEKNSFFYLPLVSTLILDNNPIVAIEPGAFNGLNSLTELQLYNQLYLTTVDLLIASGVKNLLKIIFVNCSRLNTIELSDYSALPLKLDIVSLNAQMNVTRISPNIQYWLDQGYAKRVDISNNEDYQCDSTIGWMEKYVYCPPQKINANETLCAGSKQSLVTYLQSFQLSCSHASSNLKYTLVSRLIYLFFTLTISLFIN